MLDIGLKRALELVAKKARKNQALRIVGNHPDTGEPIEVRDGRYGPYVKHQKTNASLQGDQTPESVTMEEAIQLLAAREASKPTKKTKKKKTTKKKASAKSKKTAKKKTAKPKAPKATPKDLEPFLSELDDDVKNVVVQLEGMNGTKAQDVASVADTLGMSEEEVKAAHKRGMFKLRMAFGRARKEATPA